MLSNQTDLFSPPLSSQVYSLPSLGLLFQAPLASLMGQAWDPPSSSLKAARLVAASHLGHLVLLSTQGELSLLAVAKGIPEQRSSGGVYDWELAAAAHAALVSQQQRGEQSTLAAAGSAPGPLEESLVTLGGTYTLSASWMNPVPLCSDTKSILDQYVTPAGLVKASNLAPANSGGVLGSLGGAIARMHQGMD